MNGIERAKRAAARAAAGRIDPSLPVGFGSGSTVARFIHELAEAKRLPELGVSTSVATDLLLVRYGVRVVDLDNCDPPPPVYVDGADEIDPCGRAVKGRGGAHAREKYVAERIRTWVAIVDRTKFVGALIGRFGVPVEVEREQQTDFSRACADHGFRCELRRGLDSDRAHVLIDVFGVDLSDPLAAEDELDALQGVVANGIFARRKANVILVGHEDGTVDELCPDCGSETNA